MASQLPPPAFTPLAAWLHSIGRTYQWYRDNVGRDDVQPRLPRLIKQQRSNFIETKEGERYKRELRLMAGIPQRGRPRKPDLKPAA